jgi:transcriptional regulator with XRE-family HTH domain
MNPREVKHVVFALWFENELEKLGINQSEMARRLGVPRNNVSTYCTGRSVPRRSVRPRLAKLFGVPRSEVDRMAARWSS